MPNRRLPWLLAGALFAAYATLAISLHVRMRTSGFDLGIFEQAVRGYAEGRGPISELKGPGYNLLGDHFHPILATLAPFYLLFPSPITLLVAQAALFAVSAVPVTRLAMDRLGRNPGLCVGVAYGLSYGLQRALSFDFHEIAFAVPLLAFSVEALARRRWRAAVWWALPLLLVKEDLWLTVAAIGAYVAWRGARRLGLATAVGATVAGLLTVFVLIPAVNAEHLNPYVSGVGAGGPSLDRFLTQSSTLILLGLVTLFLAVRSPLVLLAVPTLAWRFYGSNPAYWTSGYHYSAVLMPIVFVAAIDALTRLDRARLIRIFAGGMLAVAVTMTVLGQPLRKLAYPSTYQVTAEVAAARRTLAVVPDGAEVAAANLLAPQLTSRCRVALFPRAGRQPEWIVTQEPVGRSPIPKDEELAAIAQLPAQGYVKVASGGGVTVYRRPL